MLIESDRDAAEPNDGLPLLPGAELQSRDEFHCSSCGYGIAVRGKLPLCPMCGGSDWEQVGSTPFGRASALPVD